MLLTTSSALFVGSPTAACRGSPASRWSTCPHCRPSRVRNCCWSWPGPRAMTRWSTSSPPDRPGAPARTCHAFRWLAAVLGLGRQLRDARVAGRLRARGGRRDGGCGPYYQQRLLALGGNEQRIVTALATHRWAAAPVREIAVAAGLEQRVAASHTGSAGRAGWVRAEKVPGTDQRTTWYRLRDPLVRYPLLAPGIVGNGCETALALLRDRVDADGDASEAQEDQVGAAVAAGQDDRPLRAGHGERPGWPPQSRRQWMVPPGARSSAHRVAGRGGVWPRGRTLTPHDHGTLGLGAACRVDVA